MWYLILKNLQVVLHGSPYKTIIDLIVSMDKIITHPYYARPWNIRICITNFSRDMICRFANYFQASNHIALLVLVDGKRLPCHICH